MVESWSAVIVGLVIGGVVGATVLLTNFCGLGAVADIVFAKDWRRMRAGILAAGVAVVGVQTLDAFMPLDLQYSSYAAPFFQWLPIIIGGVCFGFGMALAGGCLSRALSRVGAGSLKAFTVVLVAGLAALITSSGLLMPATNWLFEIGSIRFATSNSLVAILTKAMNGASYARWIATAIIGGGFLIFALKDSWFRSSRGHLIGGVLIGLCVIAAWAAGSEGINFAAPLGILVGVFTYREMPMALAAWIVVGVPLGSFIAGAFTRNLAFESFTDAADFPRHLIGAALMGFGGTLSLGCTFGQGLSGVSTLALGSFLAIGSIWFGCLWGIRSFEAGTVRAGLALTLRRGMR